MDPDQTLQNAASDQGLHFAFSSEISTKHGNDKNQPDTLYIGNGPVQRVKVEESTLHKWVKTSLV